MTEGDFVTKRELSRGHRGARSAVTWQDFLSVRMFGTSLCHSHHTVPANEQLHQALKEHIFKGVKT